MAATNRNRHLCLEERKLIEKGIESGSTKTAIARTIGKDNSTVGKEIALHRAQVFRCRLLLECSAYKHCLHGRACHLDCVDYQPFRCNRRDRSPGACNSCPEYRSCRFDKFKYEAHQAQLAYEKRLVESRQGLNLDEKDVERLAGLVVPAIKRGLSPYHVVENHPDIGLCEKTLYTYIAQGVFRPWGLIDLDLRQKTGRKLPKHAQVLYKKREDRQYLKGRTYADYLSSVQEEPDVSIVQMDTVYNDPGGPYLQTFLMLDYDFLFAFFHKERTANAMVEGINLLEDILGLDLFIQQVALLLTDRGSEFQNAEAMENTRSGLTRTRVFYCDPMASGQKGSLEKRHTELRYILPKGTDLLRLGLKDQQALNLVLSHVNSTPREKRHGKTPFELMRFFRSDMLEAFAAFGIREIPREQVILKPYLLK